MTKLENIAQQISEIFMKYLKYKKVENINFNNSELSYFLQTDEIFISIFDSNEIECSLTKDIEFVKKQVSLLEIYIDSKKIDKIKLSLDNVENCDGFIEVLGDLFNLIIEHFEIIGKSINNSWDFFEALILKINSIYSTTLNNMDEHVSFTEIDMENENRILGKIYDIGNQIEKSDDLEILKSQILNNLDDLADLVKEKISLKEKKYQNFKIQFSNLKKSFEDYKTETKKLKSNIEKYRTEALTDYLTGFYNRKYMTIRLEEEQERVKRHPSTFVLLMIDIDNFKNINDEHGHIVGDYVIKYIANIIRANTREIDVEFRFGGEEFLILLPETKLEESLKVAERLKTVVNNTVFKFKDKKIKITVSQGLAEYKEGEHYSDTIERADKMLLKAKQLGKDRIICEKD